MTFQTIALLALAAMFAMIILRVPIGGALTLTGVGALGLMLGIDTALGIVAVEVTSAFSSRELGLIPLFLLMGALATAAGLSDEIYGAARAWLGHIRGGLALTTLAASAGFGAIAGSSIATTAMMGRMAVPQMLKAGYHPAFATGSVAGGGTLGILIPPSIIMLLYAFLTEQSVLAMFFAALLPGLLTVALYSVAIFIYTWLNPDAGPAGQRVPRGERRAALRRAWRVGLLMILVSGGLYSGALSVNEAAGFGLVAALVFFLFSPARGWRSFARELRSVAGTTGFIFLLVIGANLMTYFMSVAGLPALAIGAVEAAQVSPYATLALVLAGMILLGAIFDSIAAMVITLPLVLPIVTGLGYDPIWWGIIMVVVIEIGLITPPIGLNVFVLQATTRDIPLSTIFRGILPFFLADLIRLGLLVAFPAITLWLPAKLGYL